MMATEIHDSGSVPATTTAEPPRDAPLVVIDNSGMSALMDTARFEQIQRVAKMFAASDMVPKHYQGKIPNCIIAVQMAQRLKTDVFLLMQNTYPVHGKIGMEGKMVISLINDRGPFEGNVDYEYSGEPGTDSRACTAFAIHRDTGRRCEETVTVTMAKAAGWWEQNKNWRVLTDLMLAYRSATFLGRKHCPEVLLGMQTVEEIADVRGDEVRGGADALARRLGAVVEAEYSVDDPRPTQEEPPVVEPRQEAEGESSADDLDKTDEPPGSPAPPPDGTAGPMTDEQREECHKVMGDLLVARGKENSDGVRVQQLGRVANKITGKPFASINSAEAERVLDALHQKLADENAAKEE